MCASTLSYDADNDSLPDSLVVKLPSREEGARGIGVAMGLYESETRFYKEIAPLCGIAVPHLHWGDVDAATGRITLVIDDLTGTAVVGDMLATSTPEQAELAFAAIVDLQAPVWNDSRLKELRWLADPARAQVMFDAGRARDRAVQGCVRPPARARACGARRAARAEGG